MRGLGAAALLLLSCATGTANVEQTRVSVGDEPPRQADAAGVTSTEAGSNERVDCEAPVSDVPTIRAHLKQCGLADAIALTGDLVRFPTVSAEPERKPAFEQMGQFLRAWCEREGLSFDVFGDNDVWEIAIGKGDPLIAFVMHGDVVPVGDEGWSHPAFELTREGSRLYGRGSEDDKGPIAAALVMMRALARSGVPLRGKIMLVIGNGEEHDWKPMRKYVAERAPHARHVISVDAEFPVVVGEAGFVAWELALPRVKKLAPPSDCLRPVALHAGQFLTQVPDKAVLLLKGSDKPSAVLPDGLSMSVTDQGVEVAAIGAAVHSSKSTEGRNALWALAVGTKGLDLCEGPITEMLTLVRRYFADDHWGQKLGLSQHHPVMGHLLVIPTVVRSEEERILLRVNLRRPAGKTVDAFSQDLDDALARMKRSFPQLREVGDRYVGDTLLVDPDSQLPATLLGIYGRLTGDHSGPITVRGGTYARLFEGAVSFGPSLPGRPYRGHAPNEYLEVDALHLMVRALFEAAVELDGL